MSKTETSFPALHGLLLSLILVLLDQLVKYFTTLLTYGEQIIIIPGLLNFTYILNTGISFGTFQGNNSLWLWIAIATFGLLVYWYETFSTTLSKIGYWLIIGGLLGNVIDRIFRGGVVDMFNVPWFAIFNVADAAITVAVVLLIVDEIRQKMLERHH